MALDAGFAFVSSFSESVINAVLRAYQANLLPPLTIAFPTPVMVGGTPVVIEGSAMILPPQVSLQARADNLVTVSLGFAGSVTLTGGGQFAQAEIILETTLLVGLVTNAQTVGAVQSIIVGIDLSSASVTSLTIAVLAGPPLVPLFASAVSSSAVLSVLTQAVRSIPSSLLQVTPSGLNLPISINQTYQPPGGSIFEPDTLFALQFAVQRIVAIPVNSANPNAGGLVIGVDVSEPVSTSGDPSQLVDLNTSIGPAGYVVDEEASGATFTGGGGVSHNSDFAVVINGNWLSSIVNNVISPQLVDKFPEPLADSRLSFGENALNVSFGTFSPSLNSPWSPPIPTAAAVNGVIVTANLVYYTGAIERSASGYFLPKSSGIQARAQFTADIAAIQMTSSEGPNEPPPLPSGVATATVSFSANPAGASIGVDGYQIILGLGPGNYASCVLEQGKHEIAANGAFFQSWSTVGNVTIDNPSSSDATLTVNGDGAVSLQQSGWNPYLGNTSWTMALIGTEITVPWYVAPIVFVAGYLATSIAITTISTLPGSSVGPVGGLAAVSIFQGLIDNQNNNAAQPLGSALSNASLLQNYTETILLLPGTTAPWWGVEVVDFAIYPGGIGLYVDARIATSELVHGGGFVGSIPYLLITDQDVTDPSTTPDFPGPSGFPVRFDGTFLWPLLFIPDSGGTLQWDVHNLNPIGAVLRVPPGLFNPQDPSVYIQWVIQRTDTNAILISKTLGIGQGGSAANIFSVTIDHASASLQAANGFSISCRLFRPHTTSTEEIFTTKVDVQIRDVYDRTHPYVRLGRVNGVRYVAAGYPYWGALPKGVIPRRWIKPARQGRIHRTDVWSGGRRCLVADSPGSMGVPKKGPGKGRADKANVEYVSQLGPSSFSYVDTLPISLEAVSQDRELARGVLCDYCFFGGPTRTQLRSDFPWAPAVAKLVIVPTNVICGNSATGTIVLNFPSLNGSVNVVVTSSDTTVLQVESPLVFPVEVVTASFPATTSNIQVPFTPRPVTVTAETGESSLSFVVNIISPTVADLQIAPSTVACGATCTGTITLDRASFDGDVLVDLMWEPPDFIKTTTPVIVKQGSISASFPIVAPTTIPPFGVTQGLLYGTYAGTNVSAWLTIAPGAETGVLANVSVGTPIAGGLATSGSVTLERAVTTSTIVTLATAPTVRVKAGSSVVLPVAHVPPSVTISSGSTTANFAITTEPLSPSAKNRTISIVANAFMTKSAILTLN